VRRAEKQCELFFLERETERRAEGKMSAEGGDAKTRIIHLIRYKNKAIKMIENKCCKSSSAFILPVSLGH
jgi:hypothetical protein